MTPVNVLARVTPQMRAVLDKQAELAGEAFATDVGFEEMRRAYARERAFWNEGGPVMAATVDDVVPGPYGDVRIRLYYPDADPDQATATRASDPEEATGSGPGTDPEATGLPCLVYVHGGGFVVGNLDTHDRIMRVLAASTGAVVVGVDYGLSPEAKFPRAVHECAAVVGHLREDADALGIDGANLSLAGDSGGANLCLATTLYLRDHGAPEPRCLLLYYGMFGLLDSASRRLYGGPWDGLSKADLDYYMGCYVAEPKDLESPYLDCLAADLSHGLPPCYIAAAALDPLCDDSLALAALLDESEVRHRLRVFDGVLHGFLHHGRMLPEAREALDDGAGFFRSVLAAEREGVPGAPGAATRTAPA